MLAAVSIIYLRYRALNKSKVVSLDDDKPSKPNKRRKRIIRSETPPPPPPPPSADPGAAIAEDVPFEKLLDLVDVNIETRNFSLAEKYLEEINERFVGKPPLIYFEHKLALAAKMDDFPTQVECLEKIQSLEPDDLKHIVLLSDALLKIDRAEDAKDMLEEALVKYPDEINLLKVLAKLYRKTDEHQLAIDLKQKIHLIEQELRLKGELPPDLEDLAQHAPHVNDGTQSSEVEGEKNENEPEQN